MATSQKAVELSRHLASRLKVRLPSASVAESQDSDGHPLITLGTGTAGGFNALIRVRPQAGIGTDHLGNSALAYTPSVVQFVTEGQPDASYYRQVRLATAAALPANTQAGAGVGATLTADANGALSVDSVAVVANDRVLVKDEATADDNGIYVVTATGDAGNPYILTRATDFDQSAEVRRGTIVTVTAGTVNAGTAWELVTAGTITVDTTPLVFTAVGADAETSTRQQLAHLLGECFGSGAQAEWYEAVAGSVPAVADITSTKLVARYSDLYWSAAKSA